MPRNFNVNPWNNDYTESKGDLSVLFKHSVALQGREVNNSQSIQQNQVTRLANHLFANGAMVIPGQITFDGSYSYVKLGTINSSVLDSIDPDLTGTNPLIYGTSGITAQILKIVRAEGSDPDTLYVKYTNSGGTGDDTGTIKTFTPNESLSLTVSGPSIVLVENDILAVGQGSSASIQDGVYFIYGYMIQVLSQTIILDKYTNTPTYKVGLNVVESVATAQDDPTLNDNAAGSFNFAAPGADRYRIVLELDKRDTDSVSDETFVELLRLFNGVKQSVVDKTAYSIIGDTLARRTSDLSGDFFLKPFPIDIKEHLKDTDHPNGVYTVEQGGDVTKLAVGLGPSKAYVKGYEIETLVTTYDNIDKARETALDNNSRTRAYLGNYIYINRVFSFPTYDQLKTIQLHDGKIATDGTSGGSQIGTASARALEYYSGTIDVAGPTTGAVYKMFLFNITLDTGKTLDDVKSYYIAGGTGSLVAATGNVLSQISVRNATGTINVGDVISDTLTGAITEKVISLHISPTAGILLTESTSTGVIADGAQVTIGSTPFFGQLFSRDKIFDTNHSVLLYKLPQSIIKTIRASDDSIDTTYTVRRVITLNSTGSTITFTTGANEVFAPFDNKDFIATIEDNSDGGLEGNIIDLENANLDTSVSTQFTFDVPAGHTIKLSATIVKQIAGEKVKTLVDNTLSPLLASTPGTTVSLGKPDIFSLISVIENSSTDDISDRYTLDDGQRDNLYDLGSITLKPGSPPPVSGGITVYFKYFNHSGNGDYFSVDSYNNFTDSWYENIPNYKSISSGKLYNLRDVIDFRPRIDDNGTTFTNPGELVEVNTDFQCDYQYYLKRIDKIYLDYKGNFNVVKGTSSLTPLPPPNPKDGMVLYVLTLGAYTFSNKDVTIKFVENRRFTERDISDIVNRVTRLEYYTALNLLEKETASLTITDTTTGLDRFKNGFIVDNFKGHSVGDVFDPSYQCSIDAVQGILRPQYFSANVGMDFAEANSANFEYRIKKPTNDLLTCKYTEAVFLDQPFASKVENVNPYSIYNWIGSMTLDPPSDDWKDTATRPDILVNDDSAFDNVNFLVQASRVLGTIWNEWQTDWSGVSTSSTVVGQTTSEPHTVSDPSFHFGGGPNHDLRQAITTTSDVITTTTSSQTRQGLTTTVVPNVVQTTVDDRIVNVTMIPYIRSRYVRFTAKRLKPLTKVYAYFDGVAVSAYAKPIGTGTGLSDDPSTALADPLFTDGIGNVSGWFIIPPTSTSDTNKFKTGQRIFRLTDSLTNSPEDTTTFADATYTAAGVLETTQNTITSVRVPEFVSQSVSDSRILTTTNDRLQTSVTYVDPLAQSFLITGFPGGIFLSKVALKFFTVDDTLPVTVQIREMVNGYPSQKVVPFSEVDLIPSPGVAPLSPVDNVAYESDDATATSFAVFPSPVYLQNNVEYALVIMANTNNYQVFVGQLGERLINSDRVISQQPYAGSFFKSQNASTWTAEQLEDLTFTIYRCVFDTNPTGATVYFNNHTLDVSALKSLPFSTCKSSALLRVYDPDHGMPNGSSVLITIPAAEFASVWNGITAVQITPNITSLVDGTATFVIQNVDVDNYIISTAGTATDSGATGPDGVTATRNLQMDLLYLNAQHLLFSNTQIQWGLKTTLSQSVDGTQGGVYTKDPTFSATQVNENVPFTQPRLVASATNESVNVIGTSAFDKKSLVLQAILTTNVDNVSPVIDSRRISATVISNRINNTSAVNRNVIGMDDIPEKVITGTDISFVAADGHIHWTTSDTLGHDFSQLQENKYITISGTTSGLNDRNFANQVRITKIDAANKIIYVDTTLVDQSASPSVVITFFDNFVDERSHFGGTGPSRYIIRTASLVNAANSIKSFITAVRPPEASVDIYYRVLSPDLESLVDVDWVVLDLDPQIDGSASQSPTDFKEYSYGVDQVGDFDHFQVKIVFRSTNSSQVPQLKDFRGIALGT